MDLLPLLEGEKVGDSLPLLGKGRDKRDFCFSLGLLQKAVNFQTLPKRRLISYLGNHVAVLF